MYTYGRRMVSSVKRSVLQSILREILDKRFKYDGANNADTESTGSVVDASTLRNPSNPTPLVTRKRKTRVEDGNRTPTLVHPSPPHDGIMGYDDADERSYKKQKTGESKCFRVDQSQSTLLSCIPHEVLQHTLSFLTGSTDRYALQLTCRQFHLISNTHHMLQALDLEGDPETGVRGILQHVREPEEAIERLIKFASCGNLQALYMIGMIKAYCHDGTRSGVSILRSAARLGCVRSSYALGLILRDSAKADAKRFLMEAANGGYLPAWQELVSAPEMKARYGDLDALTLKRYLDPICLNRVLGRYYLHCSEVRKVQTSHCWNPLCGRWAYKATSANNAFSNANMNSNHIHFSPPSPPQPRPMAPHIEAALLALTQHDTESSTCVQSRDSSPAKLCVDEPSSKPWRVSRMKMCSSCRRAKYCSKLCQVYDWRSGRHKMECQYL